MKLQNERQERQVFQSESFNGDTVWGAGCSQRGLVSISWCCRHKDSDGISVQHRATVAAWCAYSSLLWIVHSPTMISSQIQMSLSRQHEFLVVSHGRYFCYPQCSCFRGVRIFKVSASVCIESQGSDFDRRPRMPKERIWEAS